MCICGRYLHFHSGCVAKLWAGSWVFLSQVPPSSSGHWTYEAPSSPPRTESDNNGPLQRQRGVLSGRCLAEYQDKLSPFVNSETMQLSIAGGHTMSFSLTHKSCLTFWNKGTKGILCRFLSQSPCLLTNIVKTNLSNIVRLHLLCSHCVSAMCAYRDHWLQTAGSSQPSDISPNVNSINTHTWKEGWFTHHKLLYKRGWHALYCPRLFIAKRLQECCHCCRFIDVPALCCCGFACLLCGVMFIVFFFFFFQELLSHGRQDLRWLLSPACSPQLLLIVLSTGKHFKRPAACRCQRFSNP